MAYGFYWKDLSQRIRNLGVNPALTRLWDHANYTNNNLGWNSNAGD